MRQKLQVIEIKTNQGVLPSPLFSFRDRVKQYLDRTSTYSFKLSAVEKTSFESLNRLSNHILVFEADS